MWSDSVEEQLVEIWEELLAVRPIGVQDDFFELGGHSLLVVRLMSRIKRQMGKSLPLAAIFEGGTIEQLARRINREEALADWSPLVRLQAGGSERPFFLVHPVGGNVLSYGALVNHLGRERGYYGLQAHGLMEGQSPLKRVDEMATEYLAALRTVQPEGPYLLGGWSMGGVVAFEMARQLTAQEQQVELLALIDSKIPLGER
jgi:pimeloyl-ACP methyl ester carboxylesterase